MQIDGSTDFGRRVLTRLREETVIWLVTVRSNGTPEPSPVWFYWDDQAILIYSLRSTAREKNLRDNPKVALHFDSARGGDVVVITGTARVDETAPVAKDHAGYVGKYREDFTRIGSTPDRFGMRYSLPIRVTPESLRGHL